MALLYSLGRKAQGGFSLPDLVTMLILSLSGEWHERRTTEMEVIGSVEVSVMPLAGF